MGFCSNKYINSIIYQKGFKLCLFISNTGEIYNSQI